MLIDSHCHLPHEKYGKPADVLVTEAKKSGVEKLIIIGTSVEDSKISVETARKYQDVFSSVGCYPHEDLDLSLAKIQGSLEDLIREFPKKIVGIGECGIDITDWNDGRNLDEQVNLFETQIQMCQKYGLPLIIHNRNGDKQVLELLKKYPDVKGVSHCFSQGWDFAKKILDAGFYISFSGMITYPKNSHLIEVVQKVPDDRFLVETDAPYLPPQSKRGQINEPKYVKIVAEKVAEIKQRKIDEISRISYENTCRLFQLEKG